MNGEAELSQFMYYESWQLISKLNKIHNQNQPQQPELKSKVNALLKNKKLGASKIRSGLIVLDTSILNGSRK